MRKKRPSLPTITQHSAGGVVYRWHKGELQYLLGYHSGYHKWVLPKGMIEAEETPLTAALREIQEETGVTANPITDQPLHETSFWFTALKQDPTIEDLPVKPTKKYPEQPDFKKIPDDQKIRIHKTVTYFLCEYKSGSTADHNWEMEQAEWFPYSQALKKLAFVGEKQALTHANQILTGKAN